MTVLPIITADQVRALPDRAREVIEYPKSGLSLNHVQGCPLDCAYCIRHTYGLWDRRRPQALMSDAEAVAHLVTHRYFIPHVTPLQLFNRATDPFLPQVREHTFAVLADLDARGLRNHVLVITRCRQAIVAVYRVICEIAWILICDPSARYRELGPDYTIPSAPRPAAVIPAPGATPTGDDAGTG